IIAIRNSIIAAFASSTPHTTRSVSTSGVRPVSTTKVTPADSSAKTTVIGPNRPVKRGADDRPASDKRDVATSSTFVMRDADPQQLGRDKSQWTLGSGQLRLAADAILQQCCSKAT